MKTPRAAPLVLSIVMVTACATSTPPSPAPPTTAVTTAPATASPPPASASPRAAPTDAPTPTPTPSGWPFTAANISKLALGPDETAYLTGTRGLRGELGWQAVALDAGGHVEPGWPFVLAPGADSESHVDPLPAPAAGPHGSVYFADVGQPEVGFVLHRLGSDGRELPGWPFVLPPSDRCPADDCSSLLLVAPDGVAYVATGAQSPGRQQILAIDAAGQVKAGWPATLDGDVDPRLEPQLGSDGALLVATRPNGIDNPATIWAVAPDGTVRPGWPVSPSPRLRGYLAGPNGTVVAWWYDPPTSPEETICSQARQTKFTVLGPDGRTMPGWPRASWGWASDPVADAEGTVYYASARGNVYAHDKVGEVKDGWPVSAPGVFPACGRYGPYLAPDGTVYVLGDEVVAMAPDGEAWRYRPTGELGWFSCTTDGQSRPAPAFGADGTTYVTVFHTDAAAETGWAEVVGLDRRGRVKAGWPYRLAIEWHKGEVDSLAVSPGGLLYVATRMCGGPDIRATLVALDPEGNISE